MEPRATASARQANDRRGQGMATTRPAAQSYDHQAPPIDQIARRIRGADPPPLRARRVRQDDAGAGVDRDASRARGLVPRRDEDARCCCARRDARRLLTGSWHLQDGTSKRVRGLASLHQDPRRYGSSSRGGDHNRTIEACWLSTTTTMPIGSPDSEELIATLRGSQPTSVWYSRVALRPSWLTHRMAVYGEAIVVGPGRARLHR